MLAKTLGHSRKYAALGKEAGKVGEFAQALYAMLIANSDDFGRQAGDPFTVKLAVWPSSPRPERDFVSALTAMHRVGLIQWYQTDDGEQVIEITGFDKFQTGLHKRTDSKFPGNSGKFPEIPTQLKGREEKGREPIQSPPNAAGTVDEDLATDHVKGGEVHAFLKTFCQLYSKHRHGARYFVKREKDIPLIRRLLLVYGAERLEKLAVVMFHSDDDFITETDRGIGILSVKASWLDGELAAHEARKRGVA